MLKFNDSSAAMVICTCVCVCLYCYREKYASSHYWRTIYVTLLCVDHVTIQKRTYHVFQLSFI